MQTVQPTAASESFSVNNSFTERHAWMLAAVLMVGGIVALATAMVGARTITTILPTTISRRPFFARAKILTSFRSNRSAKNMDSNTTREFLTAPNPPLLIRMFTWLAWLPPTAAFGVWSIVEIACLVGLFEATRRIVRWRADDVRFWLFVGLVVSSTSLQSHFVYSQVQLLVGVVIATAFLARRNGRGLLACGLIALATGFKIYPAVLLPWFVLSSASRPSDPLRRAAIAAAVFAGVFAVTGPEAWISFARNGLPVIQANMSIVSHTNYSIQAVLINSLGGLTSYVQPDSDGHVVAAIARLASPVMILVVYLALYLRRRRLSDMAAFSVLTITMILCSPVAWSHYLVLMIPPAAILFANAGQFGTPRTRQTVYVLAVLALMPCLDSILLGASDHPLSWLVHYYPLYTLLALAILFFQAPKNFGLYEERTTSQPAVLA